MLLIHLLLRSVCFATTLSKALPYAPASPRPIFTTTAATRLASTSLSLSSSTQQQDPGATNDLTDKGLLKRDRYVATNRFAVRKGKEAKFEQRWANRKSRLAELPGFQYFHLMRRVTLEEDGTSTYDGGNDKDSVQGNYVSFTVWNQKSDFSAWRKGSAFKEAHGGTSIGAFLSTMLNSVKVLKGAPRPAFYDGLLVQSTKPEQLAETVDGWRQVEANGVDLLPVECFVACNQFFVPSDNAAAFEERWATRKSQLKECDGFVAFSMLRRDGQAKGHGTVEMSSNEPTYQSTTIWRDRAAFDAWRTGSAFKHVHGSKDDKKADTKNEDSNKEAAAPPAPLWSRPPVPVFYEATLVISSPEGA